MVRTQEKRLTGVHLTLFLGIGEKVGNPSSKDPVIANIVEMVYHGGIATSKCSCQFTSGRFGIRLDTSQQSVLIYGRRVVKVVFTLTTRTLRLKAIEPTSGGAFESCILREYSNNISGRL